MFRTFCAILEKTSGQLREGSQIKIEEVCYITVNNVSKKREKPFLARKKIAKRFINIDSKNRINRIYSIKLYMKHSPK